MHWEDMRRRIILVGNFSIVVAYRNVTLLKDIRLLYAWQIFQRMREWASFEDSMFLIRLTQSILSWRVSWTEIRFECWPVSWNIHGINSFELCHKKLSTKNHNKCGRWENCQLDKHSVSIHSSQPSEHIREMHLRQQY